jgi:hypothetical protein
LKTLALFSEGAAMPPLQKKMMFADFMRQSAACTGAELLLPPSCLCYDGVELQRRGLRFLQPDR